MISLMRHVELFITLATGDFEYGSGLMKWFERIEFVESEKQVGEAEAGKNEDYQYFDILPNI